MTRKKADVADTWAHAVMVCCCVTQSVPLLATLFCLPLCCFLNASHNRCTASDSPFLAPSSVFSLSLRSFHVSCQCMVRNVIHCHSSLIQKTESKFYPPKIGTVMKSNRMLGCVCEWEKKRRVKYFRLIFISAWMNFTFLSPVPPHKSAPFSDEIVPVFGCYCADACVHLFSTLSVSCAHFRFTSHIYSSRFARISMAKYGLL